ncbi:MAG: hypothetical protein LBS62_11510 [Clostridiales bacterium]|jgi:hypothetical protein|nr:hypothetical protein [Clostridiales bacterium]
MGLLYNRAAAYLFAALMVLTAVVAGGAKSLNGLRGETLDVFYIGEGDGLSMQNDLTERINQASGLAALAKRCGADSSAVDEVLAAAEELGGSDKISGKYAANLRLTEAADNLYNTLTAMNLSETDARSARNLITNLESRNTTINRTDYNARALAYNKLLQGFPGGLVSMLRLAPPLELFAEGDSQRGLFLI